MKKLTLVVRILAACLLLLASGRVLIAQQPPSGNGAKHHKYKFADLGTFGGPDSIIPFGQRIVTEHGTVVGISETDMPDPFAPNCSSPNCKVQNGFEWRNGRLDCLEVPDGHSGHTGTTLPCCGVIGLNRPPSPQ